MVCECQSEVPRCANLAEAFPTCSRWRSRSRPVSRTRASLSTSARSWPTLGVGWRGEREPERLRDCCRCSAFSALPVWRVVVVVEVGHGRANKVGHDGLYPTQPATASAGSPYVSPVRRPCRDKATVRQQDRQHAVRGPTALHMKLPEQTGGQGYEAAATHLRRLTSAACRSLCSSSSWSVERR